MSRNSHFLELYLKLDLNRNLQATQSKVANVNLRDNFLTEKNIKYKELFKRK